MAAVSTAQLQHSCVSSAPSWCAHQKVASSSSLVVSKSFCGLRLATSRFHCVGLLGLQSRVQRGKARVVCAVGDVSPEGTNYLIAGAIAVALIGTAYPLLFSRKDLCPECDGAGFIRKTGSALSANAARKDQAQIVCPNCNGLGKIGQVDK